MQKSPIKKSSPHQKPHRKVFSRASRIASSTKAVPSPSSPAGEERYPMRINKYLALKKYSTRRGADEIIKKKQVTINGRLAVLGDKVQANDKVEVTLKKKQSALLYFAYNKPRGVSVEKEEKGAASLPVGALDKDSNGLMILTNDGRITDRLLSQAYVHEKEYVVATKNNLRASFKERMEAGVDIEGVRTEPCSVEILDSRSFEVTFTDEKKHQLRRMCAALFQEVEYIRCVRIMNIELGKLPTGERREIKGEELKTFLLGLKLL
jgi:23S rRNA pseudouridine2604 synthase